MQINPAPCRTLDQYTYTKLRPQLVTADERLNRFFPAEEMEVRLWQVRVHFHRHQSHHLW